MASSPPDSAPNAPLVSQARLRPAMGTFVEIRVGTAKPLAQEVANEVFRQAFLRIAEVEKALSAHQPDSELNRLTTAPAGLHRVSRHLGAVLAAALRIHRASGGVFDPGVAPQLAEAGFLPPLPGISSAPPARIPFADMLELVEPEVVRLHHPQRLDLGGIAKGYGVDQALASLWDAGLSAATVNAGGDLATFGWRIPLTLRHPASPGRQIPFPALENGACATSAGYATRRPLAGQDNENEIVSHFFHPETGTFDPGWDSITVLAPNCTDADALTKVVQLGGAAGAEILPLFGASAWRIRPTDPLARPVRGLSSPCLEPF